MLQKQSNNIHCNAQCNFTFSYHLLLFGWFVSFMHCMSCPELHLSYSFDLEQLLFHFGVRLSENSKSRLGSGSLLTTGQSRGRLWGQSCGWLVIRSVMGSFKGSVMVPVKQGACTENRAERFVLPTAALTFSRQKFCHEGSFPIALFFEANLECTAHESFIHVKGDSFSF